MRVGQSVKLIKDAYRRLDIINPTIEQRFIDEAAYYESSLHNFIKGAWPIIEGGRVFVDGWHLEAKCEHLEAVYRGYIRQLLINEPPRCMKSTAIAVCFPAWIWTLEAQYQFLFMSYVEKLTLRDSVKCRRIIESKWYKERWGHKFQLCSDANTKLRFDNNKTGYRIASSIGGSGTGEGGDILVIDDANNAGDSESDVIREWTNDWCDGVLSTRLNDPKTGRVVAVQQRLHMQDHSGHILAKKMPDLVHLCLPMEFESARRCITVPLKKTKGIAWQDPRKKEGELLWPERFGQEEVDKIKANLNSEYKVAGQLQQRPAPAQGGIIKKVWFKWWKEPRPPRCEFVLQSWDTAFSTGADSCYSACTNWGVFKDDRDVPNVILLSAWRGKLEQPDLRRFMIRMAHNYHDVIFERPAPPQYTIKPDMILVEAGANGMPLIQELRRTGLSVNKFDPRTATGTNDNSKMHRAKMFCHLIESGLVWVPAKAPNYDCLIPFADIFVEACGMFPNDESNDYVDSMMQALIKLRTSGLIDNPDDLEFTQPYNRNQGERFY